MNIPKNEVFIKTNFLFIGVVYFFYLSIYPSSDYAIINNRDFIINILWSIVGVFAGFIIFYSLWLKRYNVITKKSFLVNSFFALLLFLLLKPFAYIVAFIDFGINGW
ncbi:MAG: hypothetical protein EOM19_04585 [Candidatus Moranbacteria bacterium]|nr:hypothetical protein [Candidatus Moranbacteria bacterium]